MMVKVKYIFMFSFLLITVVLSKECEYIIRENKDFNNINSIQNCNSISIVIKGGVYKLKHPMQLELRKEKIRGVSIKGEGIGVTTLLVENPLGAISISSLRKSTVSEITGLSIYAYQQNVDKMISIVQSSGGNQHRRNVILRDIEIANFDNKKKYSFRKAVFLKGSWRPLINNIIVTGFYGPKANKLDKIVESCFYLEETYSPSIINSRCWSAKIGLNLIGKNDPGPEGLLVENSKFVETDIGINIDFISQEPEGYITNNHINATQIGINIKNRKFMIVTNNLIYQSLQSKKYIDINFINVDYSIISNNIFHYPAKNKTYERKEIFLKNSEHNTISNNLSTEKGIIIVGDRKNNNIF